MYKKFLLILLSITLLALQNACVTGMQAGVKLSQGKYDEAIPLYIQALKENPTSVENRNKLGFSYLKTGQLDNAISEFDKVLKQEPGNSYAILYEGIAYLNKKDFDKTLELWRSFKDSEKQKVEEEVKRLLTVVMMAKNHQSAKEALQNEANLSTVSIANNTIAVVPFQDLTSDKSMKAFSKALASMITTDLTKVSKLKVVERSQVQALFNEMKLAQTGIVDESTAPRLGRLVNAENIVVGSLAKGSIKTTLSLASASAGDTKGSVSATVEEDKFYELPALMIKNVAKIMQISLTESELTAISTPHTKNYQAMVYYGNALDALDQGDWAKARNFFAKAVAADPYFILARKGRASSPDPDTPSIQDIQSPDVSVSSSFIEAVESAHAAQAEADTAAEAAAAGGGGGH